MSDKRTPKSANTTPAGESAVDLHLPPYMNRPVLVSVFLATVVGMMICIPAVMSERIAKSWPFAEPGVITISLILLAFFSIIALFHMQRFVLSSHERYERVRAEELEHAQRNIDRLQALLNVSQKIGSADNLIIVFDHITKTCADLFNCHQASLMISEKPSGDLVVRSVGGKAARIELLGERQELGQGIAGWAAQRRESLLLSRDCDPKKYPELQLKSKFASASMVVPILLEGTLVGVLNVSTRSPETDYNEEDLRALQVFAENVGTYIRHTEKMYSIKDRVRQLENAVRVAEKRTASTPTVDS